MSRPFPARQRTVHRFRRVTWPPGAPPVGLHLGVGAGMARAARRAAEIGCRALQIFGDNPTAWRRRESLPPDLEAFNEWRRRGRIAPLAVHASYLVNLAGTAQPFADQSRATLISEVRRAALYGATLVNTHIGSHRQGGHEAGVRQIAVNVRAVLAETADEVRLVLENSGGGGDGMGATLEELAEILDRVGAGPGVERLAFCLDTAHLWGAGYDVSSADGARAVIDRFAALVGLDRLAMLHLNDSRSELGSRSDRHEHVGAGRIGPHGLAALLRDARLAGVPFILETPGVEDGYDLVNLRRARLLYSGVTELPRLPAAAFRLNRRASRAAAPERQLSGRPEPS
jgi:deoxyribonuclease IV